MIKRTLKNYLSNLKFVFTPLGILTLFVLIGVSIAFSIVSNAFQSMINQVKEAISSSTADFSAAVDAAIDRLADLDWANFDKAIATITSSDWITTTLVEAVKAAFPGAGDITTQIADAVANCLSSIVLAAFLIVLLFAIGTVLGAIITKMFITRQTIKKKWWQSIVNTLFRTLAIFGITALFTWLGDLLHLPLVVTGIITSIHIFIVFYLEAYLLYGYKKISFREAMHWKPLLLLFASVAIVLAITAAEIALMYFLMLRIVVIMVGLSLLIIAVVTCTLIGDAHIQNLVIQKNHEPKLELNTGVLDETKEKETFNENV